MTSTYWRICDLAARQHDVVAVWQLKRLRLSRSEIDAGLRGWRRVYRGVCAPGELTERGWHMAAALAGGPGAAVSHQSALWLLGLHDRAPADIDVSVPGAGGRVPRDGLVFHRRRGFDRWSAFGIPVTTPAQSLRDAKLPPHELYHALDRAERREYAVTLAGDAVAKLQQRVSGHTRSPAEARFLLLCHDHRIELPLVNHRLNGVETDFHWPRLRLALEVDGYEYHWERPQFEEDRRRELLHAAAGYTVIRASASQVRDTPELVVAAVRRASADRTRSSTRRARQPK